MRAQPQALDQVAPEETKVIMKMSQPQTALCNDLQSTVQCVRVPLKKKMQIQTK